MAGEPIRSLRWLENRWWGALTRARETGAAAVSFGIPPDLHGNGYNNARLMDVASDLELNIVAPREYGACQELAGPIL